MIDPPRAEAAETMPLSLTDWAKCLFPASAVLWLRELWKLLRRRTTQLRASS